MCTIVGRLRRKLGDYAGNSSYITEPPVGYCIPEGEKPDPLDALTPQPAWRL